MVSHIALVHMLLEKHVRPGDTVIDATCGNGHDALKLAQCALIGGRGQLHCFDIQQQAIVNTEDRLSHYSKSVFMHLQSHATFPLFDPPPSTFVYNLGYLPQSSRETTTTACSTMQSLNAAFAQLQPEGALFVTLYPGHPEGEREKTALLSNINTTISKCYYYNSLSSEHAPSVLIIKKTKKNTYFPFQKNLFTNIQDTMPGTK